MSDSDAKPPVNEQPPETSVGRRDAPKVTVFGAGIAGLTVAHELAERGFRVRVIEPEMGLDRRGVTRMAIGGVARTQYALATKMTDADGWSARWCKSQPESLGDAVEAVVRVWLAPSDEAPYPLGEELAAASAKKVWLDALTLDREPAPLEPPAAPASTRAKFAANGVAIKNEKELRQWLGDVLKGGAPEIEIALTAFAKKGRSPLAEERLLAVKAWLRAAVEDLVEVDERRRARSLRIRGEVKGSDGADTKYVELRCSPKGAEPQERVSTLMLERAVDPDGRYIVRIVFQPGEDTLDERALEPKLAELTSLIANLKGASQGAFALYQPVIKIVACHTGEASGKPRRQRAGGAEAEDLGRRRAMRVWALIEARLKGTEGSAESPRPEIRISKGSADEVIVRVHAEPLAPLVVQFEEGSAKIDDSEALQASLRRLRERLSRAGASFRISITGYIDSEHDGPIPVEDAARSLALRRAKRVKELAGTIFDDSVSISPSAARSGERPPRVPLNWGDSASAATHGRLAILDVHFIVLPGEHGFRFFPSYYNHVFDTMKRIPLLDEDGEETGRTVYDNVIPTPNQGVAQRGYSPLILPRSPPDSAYERKERFEALREMGYSTLDVTQFMLRTLRYMCTCSKRRAAELEGISWWEYLQGVDPKSRIQRYTYSARFTRDITTQSRTLASFDAVWGDARTCGNTWIQLAYNWLKPTAKVDGTLNGPTSEAWFDPWRTYLERRLGVEFVNGELITLSLWPKSNTEFDLVAKVAYPLTGEDAETADYFVVALDAKAAEEVTNEISTDPEQGGKIGVASGLNGFTTRVRPEPPDQGPGRLRKPDGKYGLEKWDRFQTMSGIQFFFKQEFKLNDGYVYFNKAAWALTSINSAQFWERRPTFERDGFASILSIDLCDWNERAGRGHVVDKSAWECTVPEIAEEVWSQIEHELRRTVEAKRPNEETSEIWEAGRPPKPTWFHLDSNIELGIAEEARDRPLRNRTPYLVPIKGDWQNRPGSRPWDPSPSVVNPPPDYPPEARSRAEWQADHGGYLVHHDKLVFAGVYLKTFTRMSTMEAANESGRHAVNAILDHYLWKHPGDHPEKARGTGTRADYSEWADRSTEARHMKSAVFYTATRAGDYCRIWDPEHWEIPDFVQAKMHDEWCFDHGLPHPWDLWGVEAIPTMLSRAFNAGAAAAPGGGPGASSPDSLEAALEPILRSMYPTGGWDSILQALRTYRRAIDEQMRKAADFERGVPGT